MLIDLLSDTFTQVTWDNQLLSSTVSTAGMSLQHQPPCWSLLRVSIKKSSVPYSISVQIVGNTTETLVFPEPEAVIETAESVNLFSSVTNLIIDAPLNSEIRVLSILPTGSPALRTSSQTIAGKIVRRRFAEFRLVDEGLVPISRNVLVSNSPLTLNAIIVAEDKKWSIKSVREFQVGFEKLYAGEINELGEGAQGPADF